MLLEAPSIWLSENVFPTLLSNRMPELYSKVLDEFDIKDPIEKENLKIRFLIVLRKLSSIFDNIEVFSKNGVLIV